MEDIPTDDHGVRLRVVDYLHQLVQKGLMLNAAVESVQILAEVPVTRVYDFH